MELVSCSAERTEALGRTIGSLLQPGAFLALHGDLGGGKTCFARGIAAAVAPDSAGLAASPTFAIMNEYPGPVPVYHFDFYRLGGSDDVRELGFDDFFRGNGVCIAEWAERLGETLPADRLDITFEYLEHDRRRITLRAAGDASRAVLDNLTSRLEPEDFL